MKHIIHLSLFSSFIDSFILKFLWTELVGFIRSEWVRGGGGGSNSRREGGPKPTEENGCRTRWHGLWSGDF